MERTDEETPARFTLSLQVNSFSTDLLRKRSNPTSHDNLKSNEVDGGPDELELSLGLSTNGRFGVDPTKKRLKRSSSISDFPFAASPWENGGAAHHDAALLPRTRSLPTEAEEEWRKRKEYQSMRRFEARKKRLEKVKSGLRAVVKDSKEISSEDVLVGGDKLCGNNVPAVNGNENAKPLVGSQMNCSSPSSGSDRCQQLQAPKQNREVPPPPPPRRSPENHKQETNIAKNGALNRNASKESAKNAMLDMPHVCTREKGPDGRKIEGFLYRYKKGEAVSIVCVCHGMFLSPAEFVKHGGVGGGADVENPLKHIVVSPFPLV